MRGPSGSPSLLRSLVTGACAAFVVAAGLGADELHVAPPPAGSDAQSGTAGSPWATLRHAADQVDPGDVVIVHAGDYTGFQLTASGTEAMPIVFRAADGDVVRIVEDNPSTPDGINVEGGDHVVVEGFLVEGATRAGIRAVLCEHVTIRGNEAYDNGVWGIFTGFCDDLLIEDNVTTGSLDEHGIYVSNSGDRPTIRGNVAWGNNANGIHMNGDASAGGDGVISDAVVEDNVLFDNGVAGGSGINCDGVQDSVIRNNLIWDTHASGISLYRIDGALPSSGNRVLHNTVIVASDGRWALNVRDGSTGTEIRNNVFWSHHSWRGAVHVCEACLPGTTSDRNVVEDRFTTDDGTSVLTLVQWRQETGLDDGSVAVGDPATLFEDSASGDHHLAPGSLALDLGLPSPDVPHDLDGTPRPLGTGADAGCYEGVGVVFADGFESGGPARWAVN